MYLKYSKEIYKSLKEFYDISTIIFDENIVKKVMN